MPITVVNWSTAELADAVAAGLRRRAAQEDLEQAVYGFDHLDELGLHPVIHQALQDAGFGVWPEQRYPSDGSRPRRSEGKRCDAVLTPQGLPLRDPQTRGTLFDTLEAVDPETAYWLEIKTVAQFETSGPFRRYSSELLSTVAEDVKKLWTDSVIHHAGLLLVLFTADQPTAAHDLLAWHTRCIERGYPVAPPVVRFLPITDRIGNGCCSVAVFGVRGG